jgi:uncharacterized membrane protein YccC
MSLAIFLTLCIVGIDFLIYVLFQWTFGDKRRALQRKIEAQRRRMNEATGPVLVRSEKEKRSSRVDLRVYGAQLTVLRRLQH